MTDQAWIRTAIGATALVLVGLGGYVASQTLDFTPVKRALTSASKPAATNAVAPVTAEKPKITTEAELLAAVKKHCEGQELSKDVVDSAFAAVFAASDVSRIVFSGQLQSIAPRGEGFSVTIATPGTVHASLSLETVYAADMSEADARKLNLATKNAFVSIEGQPTFSMTHESYDELLKMKVFVVGLGLSGGKLK